MVEFNTNKLRELCADFIELDDEPYSSDLVRENLFKYLRGEK